MRRTVVPYVFTFAYPFKHGFTYTSTVRCDLDGHGDRFVNPSGWLGLGLFIASTAIYRVFSGRASKLADAVATLSPPLTSVAPVPHDATNPIPGEGLAVV